MKIELKWKKSGKKTIDFNGNEIEVESYIPVATKNALISQYLNDYFNGDSYDFIGAELSLKYFMLELLTNIEVTNDNGVVLDPDVFSCTDLWEKVVFVIINYNDFRKELERTVNDRKEQVVIENSIGKVVSGLADKLNMFLDNIQNMNITPELLEQVKETGKELIGNIEQSEVVKVLNDDRTRKTGRKSKSAKQQ